jgi:hypothetical protein
MSISTDGFQTRWRFEETLSPIRIVPLSPALPVIDIAVDPGKISLMAASFHVTGPTILDKDLGEENHASYLLSGKKWRRLISFNRKRKKKKKNTETNIKREKEEKKEKKIPNLKKDSFLRMKRFQKHQKAITKIAQEIRSCAKGLYQRVSSLQIIHPGSAKKLPPLRLIWGDGSFSHTGHHHPPSPNKGLRKALRPHFHESVLGNEYGTSKHSPCCKANVIYIDKRKRALRCSKCNRPWGRDPASSILIGELHRNLPNVPSWARRKEKGP